MKLFKIITQGGQVHIHQLRMFKQVFMAALIAALLGGGGFFSWQCSLIPFSAWRTLYEVSWAEALLATTPTTMHQKLSTRYTPAIGGAYNRRCVSIVEDPFLKKQNYLIKAFLQKRGCQSFLVGGFIMSFMMLLWLSMGFFGTRVQHIRGNILVPWKALRQLLKRSRQASDLKIARPWYRGGGKLPLVKNKETSHILITGTTGSGKTNLFHHFLPQIRKRNRWYRWGTPNRAIVVDITGDYVSRYYDPTTDIILNPLDLRSVAWNPWADCHLDAHYDVLAEALIQPKEGKSDPFWDTASRGVFKTALRKYADLGIFDVRHLTRFLLSSSDREFEDFFKNTEAATFAKKNNDKTTGSIRSVLSSQITCLKHLTPQQTASSGQAFSIRDWVRNEKQSGWIFITARPDQRETLTPLISAWINIAINALMVLPESHKRRLWFVIDELAALQRLPRLAQGLAEARKYGGCLLVGFQNKPQLEDIYGKNASDAMLDLFNTKIFFRCTEPSTQFWISRVLGDKEEIEPKESISYGAHSMRDGVSLNRQVRQVPLVIPTEFSLLKDRECYLKFPGNYPSTKFLTASRRPHSKTEPFLLIPEQRAVYAVSHGESQEGNRGVFQGTSISQEGIFPEIEEEKEI